MIEFFPSATRSPTVNTPNVYETDKTAGIITYKNHLSSRCHSPLLSLIYLITSFNKSLFPHSKNILLQLTIYSTPHVYRCLSNLIILKVEKSLSSIKKECNQMIKLENSSIQGKRAYFGQMDTNSKPLGFTLGGAWEYHAGYFD